MNTDIDNLIDDFRDAFSSVGEALEENAKAAEETAKIISNFVLQQLLLRETKFYVKMCFDNIFTHWYYKMKYRKARYARIKYQRSIIL